jgi:hypothetical protein
MRAMRRKQWALSFVAAVVSALVVGSIALAASSRKAVDTVLPYLATDGSTYTGLRLTSLGLPQIDIAGTAGASELVYHLRRYHDSGRYEQDVNLVAGEAKRYLDKRLDDDKAKAKTVRTCKTRYRRVRRGVHAGYYKRNRKCSSKKVAPKRIDGKPAIVIDIDETALSNYQSLQAAGFSAGGLVLPAALGTSPALPPVLDLYKQARKRGVAVFFVTGRPDLSEIPTTANLKSAGYAQWDGLEFKPSGLHTLEYKAGARAAIEKKGYDIVVNIGDQESDLDGGHADRAFKLANPFYFISD